MDGVPGGPVTPIAPTYHRVADSVRPVRSAVFVPASGNWMSPAQHMMENFSRVWGGSGNIVIPLQESGSVSNVFWRVLEYFDPDRLGYYLPTYLGLKRSDPTKFESWLDQSARRWAEQSDVTSYEQAREELQRDGSLRQPITLWTPPDALVAEIQKRLAPLDAENPFGHTWTADDEGQREYLDLGNIRDLGSTPIYSLSAAGIDPRIHLMLVSRIGAISATYELILSAKGVSVARSEVAEDKISAALDVCFSTDIRNRLAQDKAFSEALGEGDQPLWLPEYLDRTPFALTEIGCGWYVIGRPWRRDRPIVLTVGNNADDYALALAMDRLYRRSFWVAGSFLDEDTELSKQVRSRLAYNLDRETGYGMTPYEEEPILVTSTSMEKADWIEQASRLWTEYGKDMSGRIKWVLPQALPMPRPLRLYDSGRIMRDRYEAFVSDELAGVLDTAIPSGIEGLDQVAFTWHVDVLVDDIRLPPRSSLNELVAVTNETNKRNFRASTEGISYFSQDQFFIPAGASLDQMLLRPKVRLPDAIKLFQALLERAGLRGVTSQAGRYTQGALRLWGGLERLAADLRNEERNVFLQSYRKSTPSGVDPGVYLSGINRRFLAVGDVEQATSMDTEGAIGLLDEYVQRGILERGFCLKCETCNFASWYPLEDVGQSFRCVRCRSESWISQETWRLPPDQPNIYFQLNEVAYQAIANDVRAPVLALDKIRQESRGFLFAPEMDIYEGDQRVAEVDLWIVADAAIIIGEAKTVVRLGDDQAAQKKNASKLARIASAVSAHEVVLATTEPAWNEGSRLAITEALEETSARPRFLAALI